MNLSDLSCNGHPKSAWPLSFKGFKHVRPFWEDTLIPAMNLLKFSSRLLTSCDMKIHISPFQALKTTHIILGQICRKYLGLYLGPMHVGARPPKKTNRSSWGGTEPVWGNTSATNLFPPDQIFSESPVAIKSSPERSMYLDIFLPQTRENWAPSNNKQHESMVVWKA